MTVFTAGVKLLNPEICFYTVTETGILITNIIRIAVANTEIVHSRTFKASVSV